MSYPDGEALILAALQAHGDYSPKNTSRGNFRIRNSGNSSFYVILRMGESENEPHTMGSALTTWNTELVVYQRYVDDGSSAINLQNRLQEILEHMEQYGQLGDSSNVVVDGQVTGISGMNESGPLPGNPEWVLSVINLQWQEERNITYI